MPALLKNTLLTLIGTLLLSSCAHVRNTEALYRGKANFESGYYREAFQQLLPLASEGNREAEYAVGYMYYNGLGAPQDSDTGLFWIKKSADQDYLPANQALTAIQKNDGRG